MKLLYDEPLRLHTTIGVGGNARVFAYPETDDELLSLLGSNFFVIGRGSNLIFTDEGFDGTVISLERCFNEPVFERVDGVTPLVRTGGGISLSVLLAQAAKEGLSGLEFLWGIPGSVGGACYTNAGAFGTSFLEFVTEMRVLTYANSTITSYTKEEIEFSYRRGVRSGIVKEVLLKFKRGNVRESLLKVKKWRNEHQPMGERTAGCIFKNPPGGYAGSLIESAGLKGKRIGGASISKKHANFVINHGDATSADVLSLIELARQRVLEMFGIELEPEVEVVDRCS
ncbi:UDP-N-acetylenolpyruvoylglucosamine reductase [candidate division WOR-3 bacterium JGI_Cruoil_03_44_89]|uniref:UDP-N-acetylenolpyruvoylglucosamine reductase n=1 Tax=candidate division WOR-3 bacterium JGI_Cruoil_03_44_89 TaxID=1973748 RepID=A0A235BQI3_UNCW3|nr:MAG: UDP-N-acetylenolpyruvoylglucosamine reductase [candidate division WOR-3 bacterium JGI_Cruoil_03_44_89]